MKHPPYYIRTNKSIDRLMLVDLLRTFKPDYSLCTYYTLGGPFLEDMRIMDHFFPEMRLVSLEKNADTLRRQEFHRFNSRIELLKFTLREFMTREYSTPENERACDIFWLDYTNLSLANFEEFEVVLQSVPLGSVVRITLDAQADVELNQLDGYLSPAEVERIDALGRANLEEEYGRILERPFPGAFANPWEYAAMVQGMVKLSASSALDFTGSDRDFLPVQSTRYTDSTQMLSVTGIVCARTEIQSVRERLTSLRFANFDWNPPSEINAPALSVKERTYLEPLLPTDKDAGEILHAAIKYKIDRSAPKSKAALRHYAAYHREFPNFVKATI